VAAAEENEYLNPKSYNIGQQLSIIILFWRPSYLPNVS